jgi:hypothetical protein
LEIEEDDDDSSVEFERFDIELDEIKKSNE